MGRLEALQRKSGDAIGELTEERELPTDAVDIAAEESDREFTLRMHEHDRILLRAIHKALRRLRDGEYGECVACGDEISERRLMARPVATQCIDCQTEAERSPRRRAF